MSSTKAIYEAIVDALNAEKKPGGLLAGVGKIGYIDEVDLDKIKNEMAAQATVMVMFGGDQMDDDESARRHDVGIVIAAQSLNRIARLDTALAVLDGVRATLHNSTLGGLVAWVKALGAEPQQVGDGLACVLLTFEVCEFIGQ